MGGDQVSQAWLTVKQVADRYGLSVHYIYKQIAMGELEAIGPPYRVSSEAVSSWEEMKKVRAKEEKQPSQKPKHYVPKLLFQPPQRLRRLVG